MQPHPLHLLLPAPHLLLGSVGLSWARPRSRTGLGTKPTWWGLGLVIGAVRPAETWHVMKREHSPQLSAADHQTFPSLPQYKPPSPLPQFAESSCCVVTVMRLLVSSWMLRWISGCFACCWIPISPPESKFIFADQRFCFGGLFVPRLCLCCTSAENLFFCMYVLLGTVLFL